MKNNQQRTKERQTKKSLRFDLVLVGIIIAIIFITVNLNFISLLSRVNQGGVFLLLNRFWPPELSFTIQSTILVALWETIQMAMFGTFFGTILSIPFSLLASKNLFPRAISTFFRIQLAVIRTIPSIIWGIIFVVLFGLGARSGALALSFYTMGYLGKFQFETFEGIDSGAIEAMTALGAGKLQIIRHVIFPETANQLLSQIIFMFEYNIRAGSIIGFVGAGGIGFLLATYLEFFQLRALFTAIIYLCITVILIDFLSGVVRNRFHDENFQSLRI